MLELTLKGGIGFIIGMSITETWSTRIHLGFIMVSEANHIYDL